VKKYQKSKTLPQSWIYIAYFRYAV